MVRELRQTLFNTFLAGGDFCHLLITYVSIKPMGLPRFDPM